MRFTDAMVHPIVLLQEYHYLQENIISEIIKNGEFSGKGQLDGGSSSIAAVGFDKYRVWLPH